MFSDANRRATYFTIHRIDEAHQLSLGKGVRVGILDHSFGASRHPELYVDARNFVPTEPMGELDDEHHGYWMALTLREVGDRLPPPQ